MKELRVNVFFHQNEDVLLVGKLLQANHDIYFEYDESFIEKGIELSPFHLPLRSGVYVDRERVFDGLPGVFYDSLPDGWGLLLMDRYFRKQDRELDSISPLERLAYIGTRAMGALSYEPHLPFDMKLHQHVDLEVFAKEAEKVLKGNAEDVLTELIIAGGSPGGARPKVLIAYDEKSHNVISGYAKVPLHYKQYLVKFPINAFMNEQAEVEYAYSLMAKNCGIDMPNTMLFDVGHFGKAFGVERFDRDGEKRIHMHTLGGLLHANFRLPNLDYIEYLKATQLLTHSDDEIEQAYKRMVFNVFAHNRDDHSKNFSFILCDNQWRLSPAYDLTYSAGLAGEHTMTIAGEGANPGLEQLLMVAKKINFSPKKANELIDQVQSSIGQWKQFAEQAGVDEETAKVMANRLGLFSSGSDR